MLSVEDDVDRYCLGLSCTLLFSICEERWLKTYTETFRRPRLIAVAAKESPWSSIPQGSMHYFRHLRNRESISTDTDSTPDPIEPYNVIKDLPRIPESNSISTPDPLVFVLRQLGEKVWERMAQNMQPLQREELDPVITTREITVDEAMTAGIPEAFILSRSLMFHIPTPAKPSPFTDQPRVLRNHTQKVFALEDPLFSMYRKGFQAGKPITGGLFAGVTDRMPTFAYMVSTRIFASIADDPAVTGEWAGNEIDVVSETEFYRDLTLLTAKDCAEWKNFSRQAMESFWEIGKTFYGDMAWEPLELSLNGELKSRKTAKELLNDYGRTF